MNIPPYLAARLAAFIMAIIVFYFIHQSSAVLKKKWIESFLSLITTVFVYMFLMKFLTKFSMLFEYPMAVVTYPSGSIEFYLALIAAVLYYIKTARMEEDPAAFHSAIMQLAAGTQFFFYFLVIIFQDENAWIELSLWFLLFTASLIINSHYLLLLFLGVSAAAVLSFPLTVPDVMGIRVHAMFYIVLCALFLVLLLMRRRSL
ncbi:hypothetical protein [Halobacillus sp. Marseille-Q1614]|uniref:hypothetical protein n=1 Tax=Halobacillus sp. Marseille-Q1614 TaxID=2709134 RepID=UPI0015713309|nr:hypothetical protein [Halobacillus sp. Marseille-Q1614]